MKNSSATKKLLNQGRPNFEKLSIKFFIPPIILFFAVSTELFNSG